MTYAIDGSGVTRSSARPARTALLRDDDRATEPRDERGVARHRDHEVRAPGEPADLGIGIGGVPRQDARVEQVEDDREADREHHVAPVAERAPDLERDEGGERGERSREDWRSHGRSWTWSSGCLLGARRIRGQGEKRLLEVRPAHFEIADRHVAGEQRLDRCRRRRSSSGGRSRPGCRRPSRRAGARACPASGAVVTNWTVRPPTRSRSERPVPSATTRPRSSTITRSATWSASSR